MRLGHFGLAMVDRKDSRSEKNTNKRLSDGKITSCRFIYAKRGQSITRQKELFNKCP
jgi:hypothetical protein